MTVLVRADASLEIGTGHVMRCLALAHRLRMQGRRVIFLCRLHPGHLLDYIIKSGFEAQGLPVSRSIAPSDQEPPNQAWLGASWEEDAGYVGKVIDSLEGENGPSTPLGLVVDHYGLDAHWESRLRPRLRWIAAIDDLADRRHACDILLDQNLYQSATTRYVGRLEPGCRQLLGPMYALLRAEFAEVRSTLSRSASGLRKILVFFGGVDAGNNTSKALDALLLIERDDLEIDVVIGASHPMRGLLENRCRGLPRLRLMVQVDRMADVMAKADLSIGAGGTASWERCCLGLPCLALCMADNQKELLENLEREGAIMYLGDQSRVTPEKIAAAVMRMASDPQNLRDMSKRAFALVDGGGAERVAMAMADHFGTDKGR